MGRSTKASSRPKYEAIGSGPTKERTAPPLDYRIKKFCRQNPWVLVGMAGVLVMWFLMYLFGRSRAAGNFASSQSMEFSSSADYKLPKRLSGFEAISRGTKQYAFNVMKGSVAYDEESGKSAAVTGFDFCYTETKMYTVSKRVSKSEKVHELTAMMFSTEDLAIKSLLISPRDMVLEADTDSVQPRADPDVDDLMQKDSSQDNDEEEEDAEKPVAAAETAAEANSTASDSDKEEPEEPKVEAEPELDTLSSKFNSTFVVETLDVNQSAVVISPGLKKLLLKQPGFILDFQDNRFLIYREFTFEPQDYHTVLTLGKAVLNELNRKIPAPTAGVDMNANPIQFVSRSKDEDTP